MAPSCSKLDACGMDDMFRKVARKCAEVTDWLCPITGLLMKDPVTAKDGFNYERSAITNWFAKIGKVSPQTKKEIGDELETNQDLREAIEQFKTFVDGSTDSLKLTWKHHGMCSGMRNVTLSRDDVCKGQPLEGEKVQMCQALSKFFKELDPIEDLLYRMLNGLRPPKIVVVGDESHGKSTILEMLAMLPFFPRKRSCCTCMAIHLRLRRTPGVSCATLTVLNADGQEELCREIPQENGWLIVQEEMSRLQEELFGSDWKGARIISDKTIVVKVERPDVPCLDLVDLPGMVRLPEEKAEQIHKIYQRQLKDDRDTGNQCMYLAVVDASRLQPNATCVMPFIMAEGLQDRTFGIFSKCDKNSDADVLRALTLNENTDEDETPESVGGVHLKNGWVATMQEPPHGQHFNYHNFERMYRQLKQEAEWFQNPNTPEREKHWPRLVEQKSAGIADLVPRVQQMYLNNLQVVWKEYAMLQILEKEAATELCLNMLGVMEDEDKKSRLAQQEVQRRLGPSSQVTKNMYESFVKNVLHKEMHDKVREILADFAVGLPCPGHEFPKLLQQIKEKLLDLTQEVVVQMKTRMVDAVSDILCAESQLCKDGPCNFNIRIATLRLYEKGICQSQWDLQERLKEEPILQICHYKTYIGEIMEKYAVMLSQRELHLRQSLESLINRLVDVDLPSPYLQVTSAFLSQDASETDFTDSRVIIHCKWKDFLNAFLRCCYRHIPHPNEMQNLHADISVGEETKEARALFDGLRKELDLVRTAKASIIRALSIEDEDLRSINDKFEVEQVCKVELTVEDFKVPQQVVTEIEERADPEVRAQVQPEDMPTTEVQIEVQPEDMPTTEVQIEANANEDMAKTATPSGCGSWEPLTSSSSPTSEGFWHVKAEAELSGKDEEASLPMDSSPAAPSENEANEAPKEIAASRKQKKGKNRW